MQDFNNTNDFSGEHTGGGMSELDILKLGMDICDALEPYERTNTVHNGIFVENVFRGWSGEYVLGAPSDSAHDIAFAAPELRRGGAATTRSDIYSLGMLLQYYLTNNMLMSSVDFDAIICKACAPDPDKRFASVSEMKSALMSYHASKYFGNVTVSVADEVTAQTGGVSALRRDIQQTEQDEQKHRAAEDNSKRSASFTSPWDDTVVMGLPDDVDTVLFGAAGKTSFPEDTVTADFFAFQNGLSDEPIPPYLSDTDELELRGQVIANSKAVTEAQRVAYENRQKKRDYDASMGTSSKKGLIIGIIIAVCVLLTAGVIVSSIVLLNFLQRGTEDAEQSQAQSLTLVSAPSKLTYYPGDDIDTTGIMLEATYEDGSAEHVSSGFTISPETAERVGAQTVTVTYSGVSVTYEITVIEKPVSSLYLEALPSRREFALGEEFDFSGMVIDVLFADGSHEMIREGYTVEPTFSAELGEQKVYVSYGEKSVSFVVNIVETVVDRIEIGEMPEKLEYYVGEAFDATGLVLLANYPNGTLSEVSGGFTVTPEKFTASGKQNVVITYGGKSLEIEVDVKRANLTRLEVRTMPAKTTYTKGETLSMKGFSLWAYYDNGVRKIITNSYTYTPTLLNTVGKQTVTVSYMGKSTSFDVTVSEPVPTVTRISITQTPAKTKYIIGDTLDTTGLVVTAYYSDGTSKILTDKYTCSPTTLSNEGRTAIEVRYGNSVASFAVNVSAPVTVDGVCGAKAKWSLSSGVLTVSGSGDMDNFAENNTPWSEYNTQIKTVNIESGITSIGAYAFAHTSAQKITIADTVRKIDKTALYDMQSLSVISVDSANRSFAVKNSSLTSRDGTKLYAVALGDYTSTYTVPDGVTVIEGYRIFSGETIKKIVISRGLYSIDPTAFVDATGLEVFSVDARNVALCTSDGVLYTKNMNALVCYPAAKEGASYKIPDGVTVVRGGAFAHNTKLVELTVPATLIRIDDDAFVGADKLSSVIFEGTQTQWNSITKGSGNGALTEASVKIMQ